MYAQDTMSESARKPSDEAVEATRMSFGEHLEELRRRIIYALWGLAAATAICFHFGDVIIGILTAPYAVAMERLGFNPQMVQLDPTEAFMQYFKISLKFGIVLGAPWILYQIWKFVAAGLYPSEQKLVKMFAPVSIGLFVTGAAFMVVIVLSGLMNFLIGMSTWFPLPDADNPLASYLRDRVEVTSQPAPVGPPSQVQILTADPAEPEDGRIWFNTATGRLNVMAGGEIYASRLDKLSRKQFVQPFFNISEYLNFVVNLGLAFGLGFQIPIVVVALASLGIVSAEQMRAARKYVMLAVAILAAVLTPSPDVGTMMLLAVPMQFLFEIGLIVARLMERRRQRPPGATAL